MLINDVQDYDNKLDTIVRDFKQNIMDEDKCKRLQYDIDGIKYDIVKALRDEPNNLPLKNLMKEAEALSNFIGGVAVSTSTTPTIEQFNVANRRVNATITLVTPKDACVDVVKITIGQFVSYMFQNNTNNNYTVAYQWKSKTAMNSGSGEMGLRNHVMRQIYTNQEHPEQKLISLWGIKCKLIQ